MSKELTCKGCVREGTQDSKDFIEKCMTCRRAYRKDTKYFQEVFGDKYEKEQRLITCPICDGVGIVYTPLNGYGKITCTYCDGKKQILVEEEE